MNAEHEVTVPAEASSMEAIRRSFAPVLREWEPASAHQVLLALVECASNVVRHRDPSLGDGCIRIRGTKADGKLRFRICEFCKEHEIPVIRPRDLDEVRPGGLGTHFVEQLMSRVYYEPEEGCPDAVSLVLELHLPEVEGEA